MYLIWKTQNKALHFRFKLFKNFKVKRFLGWIWKVMHFQEKECKRHNFHANLKISTEFCTGQVFPKGIEITSQIHIRKFEEQMAWGRVPSWGSFLTSTGFAGLVRTLWMSEMTPSKAPILKPFVLQIFWCELGEWFRSLLKNLTCKSIKNCLINNYRKY